MPKKKKKGGIPDDVLDFLGQMAMGGAAEGRVTPEMEASMQGRFDRQFAGTKAALAVGKAGPLEATGDPRAVTPETGRPAFGPLAEAIPLLGDENMQRMNAADIVTLSGWIKDAEVKGENVQSAVDKFKANKGWLK